MTSATFNRWRGRWVVKVVSTRRDWHRLPGSEIVVQRKDGALIRVHLGDQLGEYGGNVRAGVKETRFFAFHPKVLELQANRPVSLL